MVQKKGQSREHGTTTNSMQGSIPKEAAYKTGDRCPSNPSPVDNKLHLRKPKSGGSTKKAVYGHFWLLANTDGINFRDNEKEIENL